MKTDYEFILKGQESELRKIAKIIDEAIMNYDYSDGDMKQFLKKHNIFIDRYFNNMDSNHISILAFLLCEEESAPSVAIIPWDDVIEGIYFDKDNLIICARCASPDGCKDFFETLLEKSNGILTSVDLICCEDEEDYDEDTEDWY